jgi:K+-transporting ATPase c subunit
MMPGVLSYGVLMFALSKATTVTIVNLVIWGVVFPALVTGLIALAVIRSIGERQENEEHKRHRRRT